MSENGRTKLVNRSESSSYLVLDQPTANFKELRLGDGFEAAPGDEITFDSHVSTEGSISASLVVIEYDSNRERIAPVFVRINTSAAYRVRENTKFALIALRIAGQGALTVDSLLVNKARAGESVESAKLRYQPKGSLAGSRKSLESTLASVRNSLRSASRDIAALEDTLTDGIELRTPAMPAIARQSARDDGVISANREALARSLFVEMAKSLPDTDGSHHFSQIDASVGIITDEYMYNFYKDVFREVHYLSPENYREVLEHSTLDAVIYVTCWKGVRNEEWKGIKFREKPAAAFDAILNHAKKFNLPTVFQSIEDPSNFDYFLPVAERFDYVFTSDIEVIDQYKQALGHDRVFYGEYGANPQVNNPVGAFRFDVTSAFFAGSYPERYPDRCADMETMFSSLPNLPRGLVIMDRNFATGDYSFPDSYQASIIGPVDHATLQKVHKVFRYNLNFNSIKSSPTMCAMRVYELQAQGKPILSNYANSVFNRFPEVRIVAHRTALADLASAELPHDEMARAQRSVARIMNGKTSFDVVGRMCSRVGLPSGAQRSSRMLIVADSDLEQVRLIVSRQKMVDAYVVPTAELVAKREMLDEFGYVAFIDAKRDYGEFYLATRLAAFKYTGSHFVTQEARFTDRGLTSGRIHEFTSSASDRELTVVSTAHPACYPFVSGRDSSITGAGYIADPYQVDYDRYCSSVSLLNRPSDGKYKLSVIVPVHNNGRFLAEKCLPSIQRNELWPLIEVILVDDGSTEPETVTTLERLSTIYDNVSLFSFDDGASGSASRPRNRGMELASAPLLAFLDPDNEISVGGYDSLVTEFDRLEASGVQLDFVSGFQVKVGAKTSVNGLHANGETLLVEDAKAKFFERGRFPVVSTQAAAISTAFLRSNNITFVEEAVGQDTLFGWKILGLARSAAFVDTAHLIYYSERLGSVTNQVTARYFEKSLLLERVQIAELQSLGILELFKEFHLPNFIENWYRPRLGLVPEGEAAYASSLLDEIGALYGYKSKTVKP